MIGSDGTLPLPMEGSLPPDLQGTLIRVGPSGPIGADGAREPVPGGDGGDDADGSDRHPGALHAVELRDGQAVWYRTHESAADAGVFWHAGSLLALPESGLPSRYTRFLEPQEFAGGLTVPIASHVHRVASDGGARPLLGTTTAGRWQNPTRSGCASASGTPAAGCGARSRLSSNEQPGSTTSG